MTNFVSGKWNEARGTLRVEKNVPVDPNGKKNFGPPPLTHCVVVMGARRRRGITYLIFVSFFTQPQFEAQKFYT